MTDTPETDELSKGEHIAHPTVWSFCRKFERERDEARVTCSELVTDSDALTLARTVVHITQERDEAREQRDSLAEALQRIRNGYGGQMTDPDCGCEDCEFLIKIDTALQSLTTTEP